jgi:NitT/TauT family transport system substrate-binding protein
MGKPSRDGFATIIVRPALCDHRANALNQRGPATMKFLRLFLAIAALMVGGLASAAASADEPMMGDGSVVRLLSNPVGTQSWPVYVMTHYGLDKKHGITLQIIPAAAIPMAISTFVSGGADVNLFQWPDLARVRQAGNDAIAVGPVLKLGADYILVPTNSTLKTVGDLKGKSLGVTTMTSVEWLVMQAVGVKIYHFDADKESDVHEAAVSLLGPMLEQGQVDAAHMFNNLTPAVLQNGKTKIMTKMDALVAQLGLPDTPFTLWGVKKAYAAEHASNVKAFLATYRDALVMMNTQDEPWLEHGKELGMNEAAIKDLEAEMRVDMMAKFTPSTEGDIRKVFETLLSVAGPDHLGVGELPAGFLTLDYQ